MLMTLGKWMMIFGMIAAVGLPACKKDRDPESQVKEETVPTAPLEFRRYLIAKYPEEMAATMCQCCNKSLRQCYDETLSPEVRGCPDT